MGKVVNDQQRSHENACAGEAAANKHDTAILFTIYTCDLCVSCWRQKCTLTGSYYESQPVGQAELLLRANGAGRAREAENGRVGGVSLEALKAHVPGGNWVTLGFDFPLVRR